MSAFRHSSICFVAAVAVALAGCGATRQPERCRNLIQNPNLENHGARWLLPSFVKLEEGAAPGLRSFVVSEGPAEGAIAQMIERSQELSGIGVIAVGYAKVVTADSIPATDEDVTARLWEGTVNLVNGYSKNRRDFPGPYARLRFTGREVASGYWKRFVTEAIPAGKARVLYPHFAFWGTRVAHGVKLHLAGLSLVEAPADGRGEPETWVACPNLPAPTPSLETATRRQWTQSLAPNGAFEDSFGMSVSNVPGEPGWREARLTARYRQGSLPADRFLISITEDGSDPRLSPTSRIVTGLAQRGVGQWETVVRVRADARPLAVAVTAAVATKEGLRPQQPPLLPAAWQRARL